MARSSASSRVLTDPEEIRMWAEERGATPACVLGTGGDGDVGMIRLDFPGYSGEGSLEPISWDDWARKFEESNLALLVQDQTADGERSNFNKLVSRDTAEKSESGRARGRASSKKGSRSSGARSSSGRATSQGSARGRSSTTRESRSTKRSSSKKGRSSTKKSASEGRSSRSGAVRGSSARKSSSRAVSGKRKSSSSTSRRSGRKAA